MPVTMSSPLAVIGNPSSAGSYAAGQDQAPAALREAGLMDALSAAGLTVRDLGDLPAQVWRPDPTMPRAQNLTDVVRNLVELHGRLIEALAEGAKVLVLGGNCTIALAAVAALRDATSELPGLLYIDRHFDSNTPESTRDGALDWMGVGHALALPGCADELADAFGPRPLLSASQVSYLGVEVGAATDFEREHVERQSLQYVDSATVAHDPIGAATAALDVLPPGPLAVHLDVDVLDFVDAPLAESTQGRNSGPRLEQLAAALSVVVGDPRCRIVSIAELNPSRSAGTVDAVPRFVDMLTRALGGESR